ncbi:MAG: ABC transporter ATP-binding protein [Clostridiales bacterium]|jgi:branched-chain amino acid transport system ATP-binding protein|nr:ABC transporter ATP-binding protein [Bacillota bacterium]NLH59225.1 ABC transporter ATP-binding protein [Clostridiales bacterium]
MLEVRDLNVYFGVIHALKGISLSVNEGEIVTLIGANGAGKTTSLRAISGLIKARSGDILLNGQSIINMSAKDRVKNGIVHVPEGRHVFTEMTVLENLELGAYLRRDKAGIAQDIKQVYKHFPILHERRKQAAGTLSGGEQQMLAIGRALMSKPKILFLDEPSMGLAPLLVQEIFSIIKTINEAGTTILLVEQNANMALQIANRAYVLENGSIRVSGSGQELLKSDAIKKAYLGG